MDLSGYDLIVNDFEPISAYARKWRFRKIDCVALSHQAAFFSKQIPRPKRKGYLAEFIFKYFAPSTRKIGLHFQNYDDFIFTPVIREEIRNIETNYKNNEVLVYLPSFSHFTLRDQFSDFAKYTFRVFSKHTKVEIHEGNVHIYPVDKLNWMKMLRQSSFAIMGAGFQGVSEMLYLKKKLLAIPMLAQYEQECNAKALSEMGVEVVETIDGNFKKRLRKWLSSAQPVLVEFRNHTDKLVRKALGIS